LRSTASGAALIAQGVFTAVFPSDCRLCGTPLTNISRLPVCSGCLLAIAPLAGPTCEVCGERVSGFSVLPNQICAACQESRPHFVKAAAYGAYDGELRELIHLLKYEQVEPAAGVLGQMLGAAIHKLGPLADSVLVVPVPLYRSKRRERGFNQAELIARAAMKGEGFRCELRADVLERTRPTVSQIGLTRPQRIENLRGAFRVPHLNRVAGRTILLVDDVLTTGTTASECARVLRKAGAEKVWIATVARTLKESGFGNGKFQPPGASIAKAS
jgi:ComF family protein